MNVKRVKGSFSVASFLFLFLIGIDSMQGWTATKRHEVTRKNEKAQKKFKAYEKSLKKEPTVNKCLLILDLKPFIS